MTVFARTGRGSERKRVLVTVLMPALARLLQPVQNVFYSIFLIVLECEFHTLPPHRESEVDEKGFVEPHRLNRFWQAADNSLEAALIIRDDIGNVNCVIGFDGFAESCRLIEIDQQAIGVCHLPAAGRELLNASSFASCSYP
jgi:hypothetical protein